MCAVVFLALHLPYLPASLEDLDSINFALGIRAFDVAHHQPHPPGYPVFILLAKALHAAGASETMALALLSVVAGTFGVMAAAALFRRLDGEGTRWSVAATGLAMTAPLYWFTAVRPLSDAAGLAAALAVQAMALAASGTRSLAAAAFGAGLASGLRSQVAWLTVPLLLYQALHHGGHRGHGGTNQNTQGLSSVSTVSPVVASVMSFAAGVLVWLLPLIIVSGGPRPYWHALFDQGAEDLGNIQMLWNNHGVRDVRDALYYAFVAPWAAWPVAAAVLACAAAGLARLTRDRPGTLVLLAAAFGPYLVFDLLFQETFTGRYALPLVVPMAYLAVAGLRALPWDSGLAIAIGLSMFCAHAGGTSIAAYSRAAAPAFRMLGAMRTVSRVDRVVPVLAMDRRESLDLRRPMTWMDDALPPGTRVLPSPPQHEWLEPVKYWNAGGRAPVWFVVDPRRTSIDLVQHGDPLAFDWPLPYPVLLSGVRPNDMHWYRVDRPEWYVGEGWALTPEAAGVANVDRRGPSIAPIDAWVYRGALAGRLMIGGRNQDPASRPRLTVVVDGPTVVDETLAPGPFLLFPSLPADPIDPRDQRTYGTVTVRASGGSRVSIEQFDVSADRPLVGFGDGWHEQEFDPGTGLRWRWLSGRGELRVAGPAARRTLHLEGESPRTYFPRGSRLIIRAGDRVAFDEVLASDFSRDVPVGRGDTIVLETDQTYVPAERSRRTRDRRRLGLRIFKVELSTEK